MREIKFRAWDKDMKEMIYNPKVNVLEDNLNGQFTCDIDDFEWMQFTGLLDKNGKEIYEGDLLQWHDEVGETTTVYFEVFYDDGNGVNSNGFKVNRTHYKGARCGGYIPPFHYKATKDMIVTGNIFENSELLK